MNEKYILKIKRQKNDHSRWAEAQWCGEDVRKNEDIIDHAAS